MSPHIRLFSWLAGWLVSFFDSRSVIIPKEQESYASNALVRLICMYVTIVDVCVVTIIS